jgi:polyisoprenoid-binding protein YceI
MLVSSMRIRMRAALIATVVTGLLGAMASSGDGVAYAADAAPARYTLDPAKSTFEYQFTQAGALNKGKFTKYTVTLDFSADSLATSKLDVVVDMNSLDTGDKERDETLKSADLFSVAKYPQARFTSTQITKTANGYDAVGKLTIRGVSRDAHVPFSFRTADEQGKPVGYLLGKTSLKRLDFGVGQGDWKATDQVGNDVSVSYSLRLVPAAH